ncbi:MAG: hypothetical protein MUC72_08890 [Acidobacteria bacterium]|jgi:hypothetical protein|nr:hypothetical protein [Acidobacteriota bacterium]
MKKGTILIIAIILAMGLAADVPQPPDPPLANDHMVQDGLLGTWRLYDLETHTFAPLDAADLTFEAEALYLGKARMLPHKEDSFFYASGGKIGENTDLFYLPLWYFTIEKDILVIHGEPSPALTTPGAAIYKKIK